MNNGDILNVSMINDAYEKMKEQAFVEKTVTTSYKNNKLNRKLYPKHEIVDDHIEVSEIYLLDYDDHLVYLMFEQHGIINDLTSSEWIKSRGIKK